MEIIFSKVHLAVDFTTTCWFCLLHPLHPGPTDAIFFFPPSRHCPRPERRTRREEEVLWLGFVFFFVKRKTKPFLCPIPFSCAKLFHSRKWFGAQLPRWVFFFNSTTATCFLFHGKFSRLKRRPFLVCTYNLPPTFCVPFVLIFLCVATFFNSGDEIVFLKIIFVWRKQTEWWSCKKKVTK